MRQSETEVAIFQMSRYLPSNGNCRLPLTENSPKFVEENTPKDNFPVGMRVLAVDDDPICLKMLEGLLHLCQYQATVTSQANTALKLLRENKDKFDLVISDVHMPDMDGFKLLELVGLEMDLPVIMLSANGDIRNVMKGIKHGACDYLLKPVRLEELKNIWQHVVRKKKVDPKEPGNGGHGDDTEKFNHANAMIDLTSKHTRKQRDHNREEEDEVDDHLNEDLSAQKRPRVVWSQELHQQFLDAVNHLGIEKAVPKRILDLMNVPGLTRENVASHLQKYRLYLKKYSAEASQQCINSSIGAVDSSFVFLDSRDAISRQSPSGALVSFDVRGPSTLNCFESFGISQNNNSAMIQFGNIQAPGTFSHHLGSPRSPQNYFLQGLPTYRKTDQLQHKKQSIGLGDISSNTLMEKNIHRLPEFKGPNNQSPFCRSSLTPNEFDGYAEISSQLSVYNTGSNPWQRSVSLIGYANQQPVVVPPNTAYSASAHVSAIATHELVSGKDRNWISCNPVEDDKHGYNSLLSEKSIAGFSNVATLSKSCKQDSDCTMKQSLHGPNKDQGSNDNLPLWQHQGQSAGVYNGRINLDLQGSMNVGVLLSVQSCNDEQLKPSSPQEPFHPDSCGSADGLLNAMITQ